MSLSRWSNSVHYIYEPCGSNWTLEVCAFGHFSVPQILRRYHEIEARAKDDGYNILQRLELRGYLVSWALFKMKKISHQDHRFHIELLREYGKIEMYARDPWNAFVVKYTRPWQDIPGGNLFKIIKRRFK